MGKRSHIPILARVMAARHQLREEFDVQPPRRASERSLTSYFEHCLLPLLEAYLGAPLQLDHNPALGLRKRNVETGEYTPRENDWRFMRYSQKDDHLEKTVGRKAGAEKTVTTKGSDIWLMKKFRRLEGPAKRKQRIPSRGFPTSKRKFGC